MNERSGKNGRYIVDENGTARCATTIIEYADSGVWPRNSERHPCGAELYVEWTFTVPISPGQMVHPLHIADEAVSSGWRVVCTNGHTLHVSSNGFSATDYAEPCAFDLLFDVEPNGRTDAS